MTDAALVVALANAQADRRPVHARTAMPYDALADTRSASEFLKPFNDNPVNAKDLAALRALQQVVLAIVNALLDRTSPPLADLNALAERQPVIHALEEAADGELHTTVRPQRHSTAGLLLLMVIDEISQLQVSRLRRCARPECDLVFYDSTRSGTQRWHAESPCGLRERQRRHQATHSARPSSSG